MTIHCSWELASQGKQQVLVKAKGYVYVFEQLLGIRLDLLLVEQLLVFMYTAYCTMENIVMIVIPPAPLTGSPFDPLWKHPIDTGDFTNLVLMKSSPDKVKGGTLPTQFLVAKCLRWMATMSCGGKCHSYVGKVRIVSQVKKYSIDETNFFFKGGIPVVCFM